MWNAAFDFWSALTFWGECTRQGAEPPAGPKKLSNICGKITFLEIFAIFGLMGEKNHFRGDVFLSEDE